MAHRTYLFRTELWALVEHMLKTETQQIQPKIEKSSPLGYQYPLAEQIMEVSTEKALKDLNLLVRIGIFLKKIFSFRMGCPHCKQSNLQVYQPCPSCHKETIHKTNLIECVNCGHIQESGESQNCQKCALKLIRQNEDYTRFSGYHCVYCNETAINPPLEFQCNNCGKTSVYEEIIHTPLYTYTLNLQEKARLYRLLGSRPILSKEKPSRKRKILSNRITYRLLSMLQRNARRSYRDIGRRLGVSEATIRARVRKLKKEGILKGFRAIVDPKKIGISNIGVILFKGTPNNIEILRIRLQNLPQIKAVFETSDTLELIALFYYHSQEKMQAFIREIGQEPNIEITKVISNSTSSKLDFSVDFESLLEESSKEN